METSKLDTETHAAAHVRKGLEQLDDVAFLKRAAHDCIANFRDAIGKAMNMLHAVEATVASVAKGLEEIDNVARVCQGEFQA